MPVTSQLTKLHVVPVDVELRIVGYKLNGELRTVLLECRPRKMVFVLGFRCKRTSVSIDAQMLMFEHGLRIG